MTRTAIIQSNYIPWKGYFDIIHDAEVFVFYDDVQYTKNDWRNRNRIKAASGPEWLTIPVGPKESRLICQVPIPDTDWAIKHWDRLKFAYQDAPFFQQYKPFFEHVYLERKWETLSELNHYLIEHIAKDFLGVKTKFYDSREFHLQGQKQDRLINLLRQLSATCYYSGPSAREYIDAARFHAEHIQLVYKDYSNYPEYPQFYPPFRHNVTILDLLFHVGEASPFYIWGWREKGSDVAVQ